MDISTKRVNVVATNRKKHTVELEKVTIGGHVFFHLKKNGNIILNCTEKEIMKLKKLFTCGA